MSKKKKIIKNMANSVFGRFVLVAQTYSREWTVYYRKTVLHLLK